MAKLTEVAHALWRGAVLPGDWAVDATAGNGYDTVVLAGLVGPAGRVVAVDIQPEAIAATRARLRDNSIAHVDAIEAGHEDLARFVEPGRRGTLAAVAFNLGYRPGGDRTIATSSETTLKGVASALPLLRAGGVLTVLAYPGHPGGADEAAAVAAWFASLPADRFEKIEYRSEVDGPTAPRLYAVHRRDPAARSDIRRD